MKTSNVAVACLLLSLMGANAQTPGNSTGANQLAALPAPTPYQIESSGPNFNVWQWQTFEPMPNGQFAAHTRRYTELSSGLNYQDPTTGQWVPSQEVIEPYAQGAIAQRGQHRVIYANNLNTSGAIDEEAPDGKRLVSNIIGLMYLDPSTGQSAQIAEVQDSEGQLIANNQVLYTNAFNGIKADVRFTYRRDGTEQDVILRAQLPPPESVGLKSESTELVVVTEFLSPPEASVWNVGADADGAEADQAISWGATSLGRGKTFSLNGADVPAVVRKQYVNVNGRYFLFEKVRYRDIQQALSSLPLQASNAKGLPGMASRQLKLPKALPAKTAGRPIRLAICEMLDKGYVLDYVSLNTAYTNYTFQGDTTYYVSGSLNLSGTNNCLEGGTVIKYATNASITIVPGGAVKFLSQPYHPVVCSSKDDNAVGQTISGSTGNPSGYYANPALNLGSLGSLALSEFRIAYANRGLSVSGASPSLYDAQFVNCATAISDISGNVSLENVLLSNIKTNFNSTSSTNVIYVQNATFNNAFDLNDGSFSNTWLYATNCAFVNVTNLSGNLVAGYNGFYQSPTVGSPAVTSTSYPLQRAGAASCYLTNGCVFLTNGTTAVDPYGLSLIQLKTVYPPLIYSNLSFSVATNFGPQAPKDTNVAPALGYHYDPLDYAFSGVQVYSNMTFSAGTAVGWFELPNSGGAGYGISIYDKVVLSFTGTASLPCTYARYSTVQEGGDGLWKNIGWLAGIAAQSLSGGYSMNPTNAAMTRSEFTRHFVLATDDNHYREYNALSQVFAQNSEFYGGGIGAYWDELSATNCLFNRVGMGVGGSNPDRWWMRNCTMRGGSLSLSEYGQTWPVWIEDCAFDGASLSVDNNSGGNTNETYCDFNAFLTNNTVLSAPGAHNVIVTNFNWQSSWLGNFYLPANSPLIDKGSTTADKFGLYHFTTQVSQMKETNSIVDISYHYVALNTNANPIDSNGDGIPDYLEDANGNGLVDNGERPWMPPPVITVQPTNLMVIQGSNAIFSVTANSLVPASYQWYFKNSVMAGATNSTLTLTNVQTVNEGAYSVIIANPAGSVTSSNAELTVLTWAVDSDYDGRNDAQEILDGTDPFNPNSVLAVRLGYFPFDDTNAWAGSAGQLPLTATNVVGIPSWSTNAALIDSTNPAILCYRDVETNGNANINLRSGTIRFWFKPDWSSTNIGGIGPGSAGRLIEVGSYNSSATNGWWTLYFSPDGNQLMLATATNGAIMTNVTAAISLMSNQWYEVNCAYTPLISTLTINNQTTNGAGVNYYPNATERAAGFRVGSDKFGTNQARGTFEELETFNYYSLSADCLPPTAPSEYVPPATGLVGWWRGENNANDSVGNGNGTAENVTYLPGVMGYSFHFDPSAKPWVGIRIPDLSVFTLTNSLSICAWVRPHGTGFQILWRGDNRPGYDPYWLSMEGTNVVQFGISDAANNTAFVQTSIPYNQWSHVVGTLDGSSGAMELYVDSVLVSQTNTAIRPFANLIPGDSPGVGIGNLNDGKNNFPFFGDLDEVALYSRPLQSNEISQIFNGESSSQAVCGVTNFGPPQLSYVNVLQLPANNDAYVIPYQTLLTNSDAFDPQGLPLVFVVNSVVSGSLMINGAPFGPGNCTINSTASVVWIPPAIMTAPNTPAFTVYVSDGIYRSANIVNVIIKQHPKTYLFGWGANDYGQVGNGFIAYQSYDANDQPIDILGEQASSGIYPRDPRWQYYTNYTHAPSELWPVRVLDVDDVVSLYSSYLDGRTLAVTDDGKLLGWGSTLADSFGIPLVTNNYQPEMYIPSPIPCQFSFGGIVSACGFSANDGLSSQLVLKLDGTVWSWGNNDYGQLGRDPSATGDLCTYGPPAAPSGQYGLLPERVQIDGNSDSEMLPGRQFVEVQAGSLAAIARCADGSVWSWGNAFAIEPGPGYYGFRLYSHGYATQPDWQSGSWTSPAIWQPQRLTALDILNAAPIIQMSARGNHYVFLRQDGSVSELGYIPSLDPFSMPGGGDAREGDFFETNAYATDPIPVTGLPTNVVQVSAGESFGAALTSDGNVWIWGVMQDTTEVEGWTADIISNVAPRQVTSLHDIAKIGTCDESVFAVDKTGALWGWGLNGNWGTDVYPIFGTYPDDTSMGYGANFYTTAVRIPGIENVRDIYCSGVNVFAIGTSVQGKPVGLTAAATNQAVLLFWTNYPAASSYIIYRSLNEESGYTPIGNTTSTSYFDQSPPLQNGQTYYYEVSAVVNGVETSPSWDVAATPYPPPLSVTNLTGSWACHGVELQWQPPLNATASPVEDYQVLVNGLQLAEVVPSATNYFDGTAVAGGNYTYAVVAINSSGQASASVNVNQTNPVVPCDPAPMVATNGSPSWLSVTPNQDGGSDQATLVWCGPTNANSWQFQASEFDASPTGPIMSFINSLAGATPDTVSAWLWSEFGSATNILLNPNTTLNTDLATLVWALNQVLTNGAPTTNDFFVSAITNGYFADNNAPLRPETIYLATNSTPQGNALVQLKRMLLDDYYTGQYFTRGGNWGSLLTGFRIHYRTLQYFNGAKLEQSLQLDVSLAQLTYNHTHQDNEAVLCGTYSYNWPIPQGALCWASVSALVDGQEGDLSSEVGPIAAHQYSGSSWNPSLQAIPGYQQVYLDWADDPNAIGYDLYFTTVANDTNSLYPGTGSWQLVPNGGGLQTDWCWHTGLATNTTYYYILVANDYFESSVPIGFAFATVTNVPAPAQYQFSATASAYDGMVNVEWMVPTNQNSVVVNPLNQTNWQFFVERKPAGSDNTNYVVLTDAGFGLAYLDSDVVDGQSYTYRVTAFDASFDRLQTVAVAYGGTSTNITPSATNGLTLLPPVPGNGYVNLTWSPIRATQFTIKRALNPSGPFDIVGSLNVNNAYLNAQNAYLDYGLQNGVMYYYQIAAITPTGFEIDSSVQGAMPLATLTPLPPGGFQGTVVPIEGTNTVSLSWHPESGVSQYQVFLQDQSSLIPLYTGRGTACMYVIPDDEQNNANAVFTFALRSANVQGLASDLVYTVVTNATLNTLGATQPVVLQVGGALNQLTVTGPTNLTVSAQVNVPGVQQVNFYSDGQLIGSASSEPYQMIWYHVPGGSHTVTAFALATSQSSSYLGSGQTATFSSDGFALTVNVEPQLSAYQTSVTDLQLPAPSLPISLSRSYSSRSMDTNSVLGIGWTAGWNTGAIRLSQALDSGWTAVDQSETWMSAQEYFITEDAAHILTMTLPDGESTSFGVHLDYNPGVTPDVSGDPAETIGMDFQDYSANPGSLSGGDTSSIDVTCPQWTQNLVWNGDVTLSVSPNEFTYIGPDGTTNIFGLALPDNETWLLTQTADRNGNSLHYVYDASKRLTTISNSCGRMVTFAYPSATEVDVFDMTALQQSGGPGDAVIKYLLTSVNGTNQLTQVLKLKDRSGVYESTSYAYGKNATDQAGFNRLTGMIDARGVLALSNSYTASSDGSGYNGDLAVQVTPGRTNTFQVDPSTYDLTVISMSGTATNTAKVTTDTSGAISGATVPVSGTSPSSTNATQVGYDSQGNLTSQTDANGNTKSYSYDTQDRLVGQSDEDGNSTSEQLNGFGQPTLSTDANGKQTTYQYDGDGNTTSMSDPSGTVTTYGYSSPVTVGNTYLGEMQTSQSQTAPFVPYTIVTLNSNQTAGPILGDLLQTTEEWQDSSSNVVGTPVTTSYTYDANGNRLTEIKTRTVDSGVEKITTTYTYDAQNRVLTTTVAATNGAIQTLAPQTTTVTYNSLGKQATSTDAANRVTTNFYDFNGNLIETAYPDGTVSCTAYDSFGRQLYVQDRAVPDGSGKATGPATENFYDASGRVIRTERCDAVQLTRTIASPGVDFVGVTNEVQFKMTVNSTGTVLSTTRTFYDAVGRVQFSVDGRGAVTEYRYDPAGRRTNVLVHVTYYNPTNDTPPNLTDTPLSTSYTYDANGNQLTVTDAAGRTTTSVYDDANRVKEVDYPAANGGTVSRYTYYDGLGRKIQETDEAGVNTAYSYDFRGLLTSVTLAVGTTQAVTTAYGYDEVGNEVRQTDAAGHATTFKYDALGRKTTRILPGSQAETLGYDLEGNLAWHTNFNGMVITNLYDVDNRLTNCSGPNYLTSYAYSPTGLRTNRTDASGVVSYGYNDLNQLTNKTVAWAGGPTVALNYRYDPLGSLTNLWSSTANGVTNVYHYDLLGRLMTVQAGSIIAAGYGYDSVGNLQSLGYPNGVTNLYQYDSRNRLTNLVWNAGSTPLASFAYTVAATGNRTALAETVNGTSRNYTWTYDYLYRLTSEGIGNIGTVNYGLDAVGNRTNRTSTISGITGQTPTYTANDWLASDTYDNNGNTSVSGTASYQYDVLNHLTNVNSGQILIKYDGDGNRASKTANGTTTYYLVDDRNPSGYAQVLEEYQGTSLSRVYNYGLALISQRQASSGTVSYYCSDGHGSTRFLTGASGNVTDAYTFDAYGLVISSSGNTPNNYLYCGQQFDSDLGFYYLRARYYKPDSGRFWTMDSNDGNSEDPLSLHKYLYCQNDPINGVDPSGHLKISPSIIRMFTKFIGLGRYISRAAAIDAAVRLLIGIKMTYVLGEAYQEEVNPAAIINCQIGTVDDDNWEECFRWRPDILDIQNYSVFESKPDNSIAIAFGAAEVQDDIYALKKRYPNETFLPGHWNPRGNPYTVVGIPGIPEISFSAEARDAGGGVMAYTIYPSPEEISAIIAAGFEAERARLFISNVNRTRVEAQWGIATLLGLMGAVL